MKTKKIIAAIAILLLFSLVFLSCGSPEVRLAKKFWEAEKAQNIDETMKLFDELQKMTPEQIAKVNVELEKLRKGK